MREKEEGRNGGDEKRERRGKEEKYFAVLPNELELAGVKLLTLPLPRPFPLSTNRYGTRVQRTMVQALGLAVYAVTTTVSSESTASTFAVSASSSTQRTLASSSTSNWRPLSTRRNLYLFSVLANKSI